jgi:hypothetical protein
VKGKAGRGAGIVVGMTTMKRKPGKEIEVIMEGTSAGAGAGAETVKGKRGGRGEETMSTREVGSVTGTAATGEERNDRAFCSSYIAFANFCSHGTRGLTLVLVTGGVHCCSESEFCLE